MTLKTLKDHSARRLAEGMSPAKVAIINLGCVRNTVDSQSIIGTLERKGHALTPVEHADTVVVNTCAFIDAAKQESIDTILGLVDLKKKGKIKKIIVAGCLAQRYGSSLVRELKEVDAFVGVQTLSQDKVQASAYLTPPYYAYVKICESCFNACSFCVIPKIKGKFVSRTIDAVIDDVRRLNERGVKEINVIGQDITAYGMDIYRRKALPGLLKQITAAAPQVPWVRLLYTHPAHITDELLDVMAAEAKVCKYLDMPLQHVSDKILKRMNRSMTYGRTVALIEKIRRKIPGVFLRTTFIVGFPGETAKDFELLLNFIQEHPFERVGVFMYSREEGTPAYALKGQVPRSTAQKRYEALMQMQQKVAERLQERFIGKTLKVLVEERAKDDMKIYTGRSEFDAPDVDGVVHVRTQKPLRIGDIIDVKITGAMAYDLTGEAA
ncbi:MAG: 30S ribosomal protein S12 methylthiotransferase RimO [Candidatus Omnitrophica bacterium]|nr:30S ribosomal protein S12 methylthiotransferase RimO [Candidatus Omnitrophota bacterium]